jgi:Pyridoxal-phosphate dependent enzyme
MSISENPFRRFDAKPMRPAQTRRQTMRVMVLVKATDKPGEFQTETRPTPPIRRPPGGLGIKGSTPSIGLGEVPQSVWPGNFSQALAYAAGRRGHACTAFAAEIATAMKIAAMRRLGAEARTAGGDSEAAKEAGCQHATAIGARFVEDGAEPAIAQGAGTIDLDWPRSPSWTRSSCRSATAPCWPGSGPRFVTSRWLLGLL